ncbi:MAG TPA: hypothetical protein VK395_38075 [Gemmataceae bacterium]|nr:hypothetical protein [Gemmataceae bacterium]
MIVLGKDGDDKGTQLERLTRTLLSHRGYRNLQTNVVGTGSEEIDVEGEFPLPAGIHDTRVYRLIAECKAYRKPVSLPEWHKFCGKLYSVEKLQTEDVQGCFVALSGVNGPVRGHYDSLKARRAKVELVTADDLLTELSKVYPLVDFKILREKLNKATDRVYQLEEVAYYADQLYRVIFFEHGAYTIIKANGEEPTQEEVAELRPMIEEAYAVMDYIDLKEEARAKKRAVEVEIALIGWLMLAGGKATIADLKPLERAGVSEQELAEAVDSLTTEGLLDSPGSGVASLPTATSKEDYKRIAQVYIAFFRIQPDVLPRVLDCPWYRDHIDTELLDVVKGFQGPMQLSPADDKAAITIMRLSPRALVNVLQPVVMIRHPFGGVDEAITRQTNRDLFMSLLFNCLHDEFIHSPVLHEHYWAAGVRELDITRKYVVKSVTGILVQDDIRHRHALGLGLDLEGAPAVFGGIKQRNAPEPWEEQPRPASA